MRDTVDEHVVPPTTPITCRLYRVYGGWYITIDHGYDGGSCAFYAHTGKVIRELLSHMLQAAVSWKGDTNQFDSGILTILGYRRLVREVDDVR